MKTLIVYATKHGAAKEIAEKIAEKIPGSTVCDLRGGNIPAISDFDCIIVGGSVYAGSIRKDAKDFVKHHAGALKLKKIGLFVSGMAKGESEQTFSANFPIDVVAAAKVKANLGGIFNPEKAGGFDKIVMKVVTKQSGYMSTISDEQIEKFVEALKDA